jgi:hypothetical protein
MSQEDVEIVRGVRIPREPAASSLARCLLTREEEQPGRRNARPSEGRRLTASTGPQSGGGLTEPAKDRRIRSMPKVIP